MAQALLYERPVSLNRDIHGNLRYSPQPNHYSFIAKLNAVPLVLSELSEAARDYPIIFVADAEENFTLAALLGLRDNENFLVDDDGNWAAGNYVPAFVRRYPFVLADTDDASQLAVCFDEAYPGFSTDKGEVLFEADGTHSPYLKQVLDFLQLFHADSLRTAAFAKRLKELGLLTPKVINVESKGQQQTMNGLWVIDIDRYRGIDDERAVELFRSGFVSAIEAHLVSLGNLQRLVARYDEHKAAGTTESTEAVPKDVVTH